MTLLMELPYTHDLILMNSSGGRGPIILLAPPRGSVAGPVYRGRCRRPQTWLTVHAIVVSTVVAGVGMPGIVSIRFRTEKERAPTAMIPPWTAKDSNLHEGARLHPWEHQCFVVLDGGHVIAIAPHQGGRQIQMWGQAGGDGRHGTAFHRTMRPADDFRSVLVAGIWPSREGHLLHTVICPHECQQTRQVEGAEHGQVALHDGHEPRRHIGKCLMNRPTKTASLGQLGDDNIGSQRQLHDTSHGISLVGRVCLLVDRRLAPRVEGRPRLWHLDPIKHEPHVATQPRDLCQRCDGADNHVSACSVAVERVGDNGRDIQ